MSKRTSFTSVTSLPKGISREAAIGFLQNHLEMIDMNPLVKERHQIPVPDHAAPDELNCVWYSLTDEISVMPGVKSSDVQYTAAFHNLPRGLQTHSYAPMGLNLRSHWTVGGTLPGEPPEPRELGIDAPLEGLYLREDVEFKCNIFMAGFVKKTLKKSHAALVERMSQKLIVPKASSQNDFKSDRMLDIPWKNQHSRSSSTDSGPAKESLSDFLNDHMGVSTGSSRLKTGSAGPTKESPYSNAELNRSTTPTRRVDSIGTLPKVSSADLKLDLPWSTSHSRTTSKASSLSRQEIDYSEIHPAIRSCHHVARSVSQSSQPDTHSQHDQHQDASIISWDSQATTTADDVGESSFFDKKELPSSPLPAFINLELGSLGSSASQELGGFLFARNSDGEVAWQNLTTKQQQQVQKQREHVAEERARRLSQKPLPIPVEMPTEQPPKPPAPVPAVELDAPTYPPGDAYNEFSLRNPFDEKSPMKPADSSQQIADVAQSDQPVYARPEYPDHVPKALTPGTDYTISRKPVRASNDELI